MNISRINFLSQFIAPMIAQEHVMLDKNAPVFRVEKIDKIDNDVSRDDQGPTYHYERNKNNKVLRLKK